MVSEMECKDAKQKLSEDLDGRLSTDESSQLEAHLKECESCQSEKLELAHINEVLNDLATPRAEAPDPEAAWEAIENKLGDIEPGDEDPYAEPILVETSGSVDIRGLVDESGEEDDLSDEQLSASSDFFGLSSDESVDEDIHLASVAPPPVLMPIAAKKSTWMVPAAVAMGVIIITVVTVAAFLFVKEGKRQKTRKKDDLAQNLDSRFEKRSNEPGIKAHDPSKPRHATADKMEEAKEKDPGSEKEENGTGVEVEDDEGNAKDEGEALDPASAQASTALRKQLGSSGRGTKSLGAIRRRPRTRRTSKSSSPSPKARKSSSKSEPAETKKASAPRRTLNDPLSALLSSGANKGGGQDSSNEKAGASLPQTLTRTQVKRIMSKADAKVKRCYQKHKETGLLRVSVSVKGSTGKISSVSVRGKFKGTPTASCALRAVRSLKFPKFSNPSQSFTYPFLLR